MTKTFTDEDITNMPTKLQLDIVKVHVGIVHVNDTKYHKDGATVMILLDSGEWVAIKPNIVLK
jgi:hypothetical protein